MEYAKASREMMDVVAEAQRQWHPGLNGSAIAVVTVDKSPKRAGKKVLGTASRPSPRIRPLLEEPVDFVVCLSEDTWADLSESQRLALCDHELSHCAYDGTTGEPRLLPHDYEEFAAVVQRHGAWRQDDGETAIQLALGLPQSAAPARVVTFRMPEKEA